MPRTAKADTLRQPVTMSGELTARIMFAGRSSSMSAQIVAWVRDALFAKKLKPGDFLGTEKDLAARFERQPHRRARRAAHAGGARHRRNPHGQRRRRAHRAGQSAPVRRSARRAARPHRRLRRRDHGRAARDRNARRRTRRRERDRRRHRQTAPAAARRAKPPSATSTSSRGCRAISTSRSPRPRTTACWSCSSSRSSTCRGRAATSPRRRNSRGTSSTFTPSSPT